MHSYYDSSALAVQFNCLIVFKWRFKLLIYTVCKHFSRLLCTLCWAQLNTDTQLYYCTTYSGDSDQQNKVQRNIFITDLCLCISGTWQTSSQCSVWDVVDLVSCLRHVTKWMTATTPSRGSVYQTGINQHKHQCSIKNMHLGYRCVYVWLMLCLWL